MEYIYELNLPPLSDAVQVELPSALDAILEKGTSYNNALTSFVASADFWKQEYLNYNECDFNHTVVRKLLPEFVGKIHVFNISQSDPNVTETPANNDVEFWGIVWIYNSGLTFEYWANDVTDADSDLFIDHNDGTMRKTWNFTQSPSHTYTLEAGKAYLVHRSVPHRFVNNTPNTCYVAWQSAAFINEVFNAMVATQVEGWNNVVSLFDDKIIK